MARPAIAGAAESSLPPDSPLSSEEDAARLARWARAQRDFERERENLGVPAGLDSSEDFDVEESESK